MTPEVVSICCWEKQASTLEEQKGGKAPTLWVLLQVGGLALCNLIHWCTCQAGWTGLEHRCKMSVSVLRDNICLNRTLFFWNVCSHWRRMWTSCLWPNLPLQLTTWGYAATECFLSDCVGCLVVLSEDGDFCSCNRKSLSEMCEIWGTRWFFHWLWESRVRFVFKTECSFRLWLNISWKANFRLVMNTHWGKHSACEYSVLHFYVHLDSSYLFDPASSHMLVSKIKPCMSKYNHVCTGKLRMAH